MFWMFGAFIVGCGFTHFMEFVTFYAPMYRLSGLVKLATAAVSWATVIGLVPLIPKALALRSPGELEREIAKRNQIKEALQRAHDELEERVKERTSELTAANAILHKEILERKRAEDRLRQVVEAAPNGILMVGADGAIIMANAQIERLFGYRKDELIGKPVEMLVPQRFCGQHPQYRATFFAAPNTRAMGAGRDLYGVRKDGTEFPVEIGLNPIQSEAGLLVLAAIIDITERKEVETQVWQKNRDLETLLYVTSHDLREPLRAVRSFARLVDDRYSPCLDDKGKDFLGRIARGADRLDHLLDDILSLSRVQRLAGQVEEVEGSAIIGEVLDRLAVRVKETEARIRIADKLPRLKVDRTWATQAVYNLIANALKFTRDGESPDVEIAGYEEANGGNVEQGLVVLDRGPGVAPQHAELIFQLFQRAVGREVEGTGAGLAIVRQIAQRHGGRAWVRARPGGGSEFIITFQSGKSDRPTHEPLLPESGPRGENGGST
jgi:PAS domain S-box-containing protein